MSAKKVEALSLIVHDKVRELRLIIGDSNIPDADREKAKKRLSKWRSLLHEQAAAASQNGPSNNGLPQAL